MSYDYNNPSIALISEKSYSTYQFNGYIKGVNGVAIQDAFNMTILYILDWLKYRITVQKTVELDEKTQAAMQNIPDISDYRIFDPASFEGIRELYDHDIKTIYYKKENTWSLRIKESDNLRDFSDKDLTPAPGRKFITDVAVSYDDMVRLAVRTTCREPVTNVENSSIVRCEFIEAISMDDSLELYSEPSMKRVYQVSAVPSGHGQYILTKNEIEDYAQDILAGEILWYPQIIFSYPLSEDINLEKISEELMGFAQIVVISEKQFNSFYKKVLKRTDLECGDICIYFNGQLQRERFREYDRTNAIIKRVKRFPVRQNREFDYPRFYKEAKTESFRTINESNPEELIATIDSYNIKHEELRRELSRARNDQQVLQNNIETLKNENKRLRYVDNKLTEKEILINNLRMVRDEVYRQMQQEKTESDAVIETYLAEKETEIDNLFGILRKTYPSRRDEIIPWIERSFCDAIILDSPVKKGFEKRMENKPVDKFCDAILFLYALVKRKYCEYDEIADYEKLLCLIKKFSPALEETPSGKSDKDKNVDLFSGYFINTVGKYNEGQTKDCLNYHIKYSANSDVQFRIYYLYAHSIKKIIIGAMPEHLPTESSNKH